MFLFFLVCLVLGFVFKDKSVSYKGFFKTMFVVGAIGVAASVIGFLFGMFWLALVVLAVAWVVSLVFKAVFA